LSGPVGHPNDPATTPSLCHLRVPIEFLDILFHPAFEAFLHCNQVLG